MASLRPRLTLTRLALALLPLLHAGQAHSGLLLWVGPASGSWADASNWSGGVLPDSQDDVILDFADVQVLGRQAANAIRSGQQLKLADPAASLTVTGSARLHSFAVLAGSYVNEGGGTSAQLLGFTGGRLGGASVTSVMGIASVGAQGGSRPVLGTGHTLSLSGDTRVLGSLSFESDTILRNRGRWLDLSAGMVNLETVGVTPGQGGADFDNQGAYIKELGGTTTLGADVRFHNSGSLSVGAGRLSLLGGSSMGGTVTVQAGATLELGRGGVNSANHTLDGGIDNRGRILMSGGVVQADAGLQLLGVTELNGSRLNLGADSSFSSLILRSGQLAATGTVNVGSLFIGGDVTFSGAALRSNTFFSNTGKLTLLEGAELQSPLAVLANQGTLAGNGGVRVAGILSNVGVLAPGADGAIGSFQVTGNLVNTGAVHIDLAPGAADRLSISGNASLGGTLSLALLNGQRLTRNSSFTVMSWGTRTDNSEFATLDFAQASGYRFATTYSATGLSVTVTAVPYTWTGAAAGGVWDVVQNWNDGTDGRPQAGDAVLLGGADTRIRTTIAAATVTGTGRLILEGGAHLILSDSASLGAASLLQGQITNNGRLVVSGPATWISTQLRGTGVTRLEGATAISGTLNDSTASVLDGHTLELAGTTTFTGRRGLSIGQGGSVVNQGSWVDQTTSDVTLGNFNGGTGRFINQGSFTKASNTRTLIGETSLEIENTGSINVNAGYLRLSGSRVNSTGTLNIAAGAELSLVSNDATLGGSVLNAGTLSLDGGVLTIAGDLLVQGSGLTRVKSIVNNNSALRIEGSVDWIESTLRGSGSTRMDGPVMLTGDRSRGVLGGHTVELAGTTTQVGTGGFSVGQDAQLRNLGTWLDAAKGNVSIGNFNGGVGRFDNVGTFTKTSAFVTEIGNGLNFVNTGTLDIQAGTLSISHDASLTAGQVLIAKGATLDLSRGNIALGGTVQNSGTLTLGGATVLVSSSATVKGGLTTFRGVIANTGQLRMAGQVDWLDGDLRGSGTTRMDGPVALRGTAGRQLRNGQTLELAGTTTQVDAGTLQTANGARLVNLGTWVDAANGNVHLGNFGGGAASRFDNVGRFTKTSAFVTDIGNGLVLNNTGTIDIQAGTLRMSQAFNNHGLLNVAAGAELASTVVDLANAGTLAGDGTVRTVGSFFSLNNTGTLAAGGLDDAGTLSLIGGLTQQAGGTFLVDLGSTAAGGFDLLTISGAASLAGTLAVNLLAGAHFNVGDSFTVMTWTQRLGDSQFASLDLTQAGGYGFTADYGANSLTLRVMTAPVPEPGSWALMAAGLLGLGALQRRRRDAH